MFYKIKTIINDNKTAFYLAILLFFISIFSIYLINPKIEGDSVSYIQSIQVIESGVTPIGFMANRIVSTFGALGSIIILSKLIGDINLSWLVLNTFFYIVMGEFFYFLLNKITNNKKISLISTLLLVTNYAVLSFGFRYLMDISGWAFYIASLYYSYKFFENKEISWLYVSASIIGIGGLFKEYAFLGYIVVFFIILINYHKDLKKLIKNILITITLSFLPVIILNIYTFNTYNYIYPDWFLNQPKYYYSSYIIEYIKSFGSLFHFGWFIFFGGLYYFYKDLKENLKEEKNIFIILVILSSLVVFVWPIVTRVLFITIPGVILVSSFYINKVNKYALVIIVILYVLTSCFMDSIILNFINLPF